jgi:hypothetical protein
MGGLLVATLLTLIVLPALYVIVMERRADRAVTGPADPARPALGAS